MKAIDAAKYLVNLAIKENKPLTNLQVQKMLYFAQVESDTTLIDDNFEAWRNGPVLPKVYSLLRINGSNPINKTFNDINENEIKNEDKNLIQNTYYKYKDYKPWDLVKLSHLQDGAWHKAVKEFIVNGEWNEDKYSKNKSRVYIQKTHIKHDKQLINNADI